MARTGYVLPRCASHKTSVSLDYHCGDEHERDAHEAQEDRGGEAENENHEARDKSGDLYGFERTAAISSQSAEQIAKTAELFGQDDDITVLTLARTA